MTDRNTISQIIESLFEDWIYKNINVHPLAVENMRILEADALALLKEQETCENCAIAIEDRQPVVRCKDCKHRPKEPDWKIYESGFDLEFPEGSKCPCRCSGDKWYSWYPEDDWFCAEGERKENG